MGAAFFTYFDYVLQDENRKFHVEESLYRFVNRPRGRIAYLISIIICFITYMSMFTVDTITTSVYCNTHHTIDTKTSIYLDPRCNYHWLLFAPNLVSLGVLVWLLLNFIQMVRYWKVEEFPLDSRLTQIQWMLFSLLYGYSYLALIMYYDKLGGVMQPHQLQVDKIIAFCIMLFYGFVGMVEIKFKHVLLGVLLLNVYVLFVCFLAWFDIFVFAPFEQPDIAFILGGTIGYALMHVLFSVVHMGIHRLKIKIFKVELYDYTAVPTIGLGKV